ncbi:MAG TPA: A/G-specific adenine glycosylase [Rhodocyclaceae bacterium]|nr:A/G-specific adenine glycosylase [Rhodocyclaceae bacterium]
MNDDTVGETGGFADRLVAWQKRHGRHGLPWQEDWRRLRDPYRIWLSEIMLQQTQVATVIPFYHRFTERFPRLADLAAAEADDVMPFWSGLGYYARARNLHRCARVLAAQHGGAFPRDPAALAALPGIGRSTANAIAAACFGTRVPILDGNVKRVLTRHFGIEGFPGTPAVERRLWALADSLVPARSVAAWHQAQMDLGATLCTRTRPRCADCPVAGSCIALRDGRIGDLPTPRGRRPTPERETTVLVVLVDGRVLLERRPPAGIWGGLLSLPELAEGEDPASRLAALGLDLLEAAELPPLPHAFTHFRLLLRPLLCHARARTAVREEGHIWLPAAELAGAALPAPVRRILMELPATRTATWGGH